MSNFGLFLLACCVTGTLAIVPEAADLQLRLFSKEQSVLHGARCLDGTPSGYYYKAGSNKTAWVIFLEGGGYCADLDSCTDRTRTNLGSSKGWKPTMTAPGLLTISSTGNKDFYSWNHIYIPYCCGDLHSGQRSKPNDWKMYFSGHLTIKAVLSDLMNTSNLEQAKQVLLTGESAGGIGAFEHADYLASLLTKATVKSAPIGGWFTPIGAMNYNEWLKKEPALPRSNSIYLLYDSFTQQACTKANPGKAYMCGPANIPFLYPYIKTPLYVIENQYDSWQLFTEQGCPSEKTSDVVHYVEYYGKLMRDSLDEVLNSTKNDGLFAPSCIAHVENFLVPYEGITINNITYGESLGDWYYKREGTTYTQLMKNCTLPCNAKCDLG
ncbi:uncharacterized protein [Oscarella lobularis]|uniref:uncharacterized protein n=1 Tax=Oscarella lobularis TaxID=121494 RepID=UPI003313F9A4